VTPAGSRILTRVDGAVATLTFNHPERHNALSLDMWRGASAALGTLAADPAVRVIVLTGAGGKAFVSGADISKFEDERATSESVAAYNRAVEDFCNRLLACDQAVIAMIRGYCIGGGVGIAVCCDLRVAAEESRFGVPAARLGLGYGIGNVGRLMNLIGPQFTAEMLFTARQFDAREALAMGLVNRVAADRDLEACVRDLAAAIAGNAPLSIRAAKGVIRELLRDPAHRDLARCEALVRACFESEDYREGRRAFLEKRKPRFTGR
jgi:enoyl-CoA hydratase